MKNIIFTSILVLITTFSYGQYDDVVKNAQTFSQDSLGVEMSIVMNIDSSWLVYDSIGGQDGPIPFSLSLAENSTWSIAEVIKPKVNKKYDDLFEMNIYYLKGQVTYVFKFSKSAIKPGQVLSGSYEFMSCNSVSGVCLPPSQYSFSYQVK
jgi:hypothetical protein